MITKSQVSRLASLSLMTSILVVAGIFSAMTAMRIAIRGKEVAVPDLTGKSELEAKQILIKNGLVLGVVQSRFVPGVKEGLVAEQNPRKDIHLKTGRSVKLLVSLGEQKYPVPSLLGKSERAAKLTLTERKLKIGITDYVHTNEGEPSTVVYQSPPPETLNGADPNVNIMVSLGPPEQYYTMPDLVGQTFDAVTAHARVEGFKIGKPSNRKYPGFAAGVVTQQKPQAGYRISKNDTILLEVSQ